MVHMQCLVDASVILVSEGDEPRWAKHFDSLRELEIYLRGGGGGFGSNTDALDKVMNTRQFQDFAIEKEHLTLFIGTERISRNVKTGEITRKDIPIENPNKPKRKRRKRNKGE